MCNPDKRRPRAWPRAWMLAALLAIALADSMAAAVAAQQNLDAWLHDDLLPYLSVRLSQHPRLKGQPFEVVAMKDGLIVSEMDGLTAYVRQQIIDTLQAVPGANLVQPLPIKPWAYRSIGEINCPVAGQAKVQVTIETTRPEAAGEVRIAVQAVDLVEHTWVSGFTKVWSGTPTEAERGRLAARYLDNSRLGSRGLPFGEHQPDLLAAYLAASVACRFKEADGGKARVFIRPPAADAGGDLRAVALLMSEYLSALPEIERIEDPRAADAALDLEAYQIDGNLYQVWAQFGGKGEARALVRSSASAYVVLSRGAPSAPPPANPAGGLIGRFELVVPVAGADCGGADLWAQGFLVLGRATHLPSGGCFAVRYQAGGRSKLYLVAQDPQGRTTRLLPSACDALHLGARDGGWLGPSEALHIPLFRDGAPGYFRLDQQPGAEGVFAIAVADADTEQALLRLIESADSPCRTQNPAKARPVLDLQALLDDLAEERGRARLDWRAGYFIHDPAPP